MFKPDCSSLDLPKISVVTPSYNQGKYIRETIDSVLSQSYPNLEYIVIDGGSTDETLSVINDYEDRIDYFVSEPDEGQSHAINKGFEQATGDILCWLNSDDQFAPDALWSVALAFIQSSADLVAGICEIYEDGQLVHRHLTSCANGPLPLQDMLDLDNGWNAGQFFYQPEVFFSKALWSRAGGYVRQDCYYSMDYELWCRFALHDANIHVIGTPLVHFRSHSEQKTAEPEKFKKELVQVRNQFCKDNGVEQKVSCRPPVDWLRKLKVAFVNDLGFLYGAGVAHMRIAGAFEMAGHQIKPFDLLKYENSEGLSKLLTDIEAFSPDLVVFGNLHAYASDHVQTLDVLENKYPCFWLTHDFWLLTGRCAYFGGCSHYLRGCDQSCPTPTAYPILEPELIAAAHTSKRQLMARAENLHFWANSSWSKEVVENYLEAKDFSQSVHVVNLGVPSDRFKPSDKFVCRKKLGIDTNHFVIAFSVSSLSDARKGGDILVEALEYLDTSSVILLLIGRMDQEIEIGRAKLVSLGYISDTSEMVTALNAADIYVGPSRKESFGQIFVEAAMCGVPSVGFSGSGVESAIVDGVTGTLVEKMSAEALAQAISCLRENNELRENMARTAQIYAKNEFSLEKSYHSMFCSLNQLKLIDQLGLPHKISLAPRSKLVYQATRSFIEMTWIERMNYIAAKSSNRVLDKLPRRHRSKLGAMLPTRIKSLILKWVLRNPYL
jgi:glycosyltransferase involved in cell wall biosynthesis